MSSIIDNPKQCSRYEKSREAFVRFLKSQKTSIDVMGLDDMCFDSRCCMRKKCMDIIASQQIETDE